MQPHRGIRAFFLFALLATVACDGDNLFATSRLIAGPGGIDGDSLDLPSLTAEYFADLAFDNEFGPVTNAVRKWALSPSVELVNAMPQDLLTVGDVLDDIGALTGLRPTIVPSNGDITVFFVPRAEFDQIVDVPTSVEGATVASWNFDFFLIGATVVVDSGTAGSLRRHIIREELAQAFGLLSDSPRLPASIFYSGASTQTAFALIDEDVLAILYSPIIVAGMTRVEVAAVLGDDAP